MLIESRQVAVDLVRLPRTVRCPHLQVDKGPCDGKPLTKRVGAKRECGPSHALANVTDALDRLESGRQFGKVVVTIVG